ncbi:hypothetical protein ABZ372_22100 [Streptomyces sp. NPDC005921]
MTLRDSPYGGTTAVVLLPEAVLADVEPESGRRDGPAAGAPSSYGGGARSSYGGGAPSSYGAAEAGRGAGPVPGPWADPAPGATPPLPTRTRQASLAPELRTGRAPGETRDLDADEMRAVFGAFQRGLDRGRRGLPAGPEEPDHTEERTRADHDQ